MSHRVKLRGWRKIANAMWRGPNDPQIYGALEIDATAMRRFIDGCRGLGHKISPTHLVGRAVALLLRDVPELNVRIVGGYAYPRPSADVFFITAIDGGRDLTGIKIDRVEHKDVIDVAVELGERAAAAKSGRDPDLAKSKQLMDALPVPVLRAALRLTSFITGDMDKSVEALGLARTPFGSAVITSVGMFGLPMGFAPLSWMYGVPLLVLVGAITDKPVAVDGKVEIRPVLPITATLDHRFVDGWHIGRAMETFRAYLESPASFEPEIAKRLGARAAERPS
ncbi:MAG TPA: 2-oxo acid dehydrogenase subunit E2 [Labilithrix sp.]|nr:2-oxo acid dehydrogenase subunit E2 [Labilithrix sp.]